MTDDGTDAGVPPPAPNWAGAVARNAESLAHSLEIARAGGSDDRDLAIGLRFAGAGFETFLGRQRSVAESTLQTDEWALAWARTVVRLVAARRFADSSLARWVLARVAPLVPADQGCSAAALEDLLEAATRLHGQADLDLWARGIESAVLAWPTNEPLTDSLLREVGAVAAWRAGGVRLRRAAQTAALALPPQVVSAVLGTGGDPGAVSNALRANAERPGEWPGLAPARRRVGSFRGFGGAWLLPPVVLGGDGYRWSVRSGGDRHTVLTDAFGTAVLPVENDPVKAAAGSDAFETLETQAWWADYGGDVTGAVRAAGSVLVSHADSHRLTLAPDHGAGLAPDQPS